MHMHICASVCIREFMCVGLYLYVSKYVCTYVYVFV
jgi:hypothetical protein